MRRAVGAGPKTTPQLVVKFGATDRQLHERIGEYPKGSKLLLGLADDDCFAAERAVLAELRSLPGTWRPRTDIGREYFEWLGEKKDGLARIGPLICRALERAGDAEGAAAVDPHRALQLAMSLVASWHQRLSKLDFFMDFDRNKALFGCRMKTEPSAWERSNVVTAVNSVLLRRKLAADDTWAEPAWRAIAEAAVLQLL